MPSSSGRRRGERRHKKPHIWTWVAEDGIVVIHPEPAQFFEVPIMLPLPEDINCIP
jgi:hypothetical protein